MTTRRICTVIASLLMSAVIAHAAELTVDFSESAGVIRPLHGANGGPICYRGLVDLSAYQSELGLPLIRLHDVPWAAFDAVDVSIIFRDFRNDPGKPENYDFASTDDYLAAIVKVGSPILYRLGESIEHTPRKYRVNPPKDFAKWAEICCGIIRHYNEGWAGGFHHDIRYWEIWNEPDGKPAMWTGTDDQSLELYEVVAKSIKKQWPNLKVGGPALANTGKFENGQFKPSDYMMRFLRRCRDNKVPLDFFSWHRYSKDPLEYALRARAVRELLDSHGFEKTESHLNEWNYLPNWDWKPLTKAGQGVVRDQWLAQIQGPTGAAFDALVLISLQDAPVDMANIFTADNQVLGMFSFSGVPQKSFYAFKAFRKLLDTPRRVRTPSCAAGELAACAGLDSAKTRASILMSSFYPATGVPEVVIRGLPWKTPAAFELYLVDAAHNLDLVRSGTLGTDGQLQVPELKAPAVVLLTLSPPEK